MAQYIQKPGGEKQKLKDAGFGTLQEAANKGAKPPEQVIEDLKERSDLPEHRFEELGG